jgi:hypothetical protein
MITLRTLFSAAIILLLFTAVIYSQDRGDNAAVFAGKLKQKVLLTEGQTSQVESILSNYLNTETDNNDARNRYRQQVESLLNDKQKAKYEIIKDNWWGEINRSTN